MDVGKLPNDVLKKIVLDRFQNKNKDVIVGPSLGEDCTAISFNDEVCVLTTDPITAAANKIGELAININLNDIASSGIEPIGVLVTILLPPKTTYDELENIIDEIDKVCIKHNIDILGGHTEVTDAVNRVVISVTAVGKGFKKDFIKTSGANVGDDVVLTGYAGLEGTSIIANDFEEYLKTKIDVNTIEKAKGLIEDISVLKAAKIAKDYGVTAMHDVTEGGVLGALWEISEAAGKGIHIIKDNIPILKETIEICKVFDIDAYKLISSGSLVVTCKNGEELCKKFIQNGINAKVVGKIIEYDKIVESNNKIEELMQPYSDEIYKVAIKEE